MSLLHKFLATERWKALAAALKEQRVESLSPELGIFAVIAAVLLSAAPVLLTFLDRLDPSTHSILPTLAFGICTVLAILVRKRMKLAYVKTTNWKQSLSLTHTAVALGCIPAVLLLIFAPELLAERHDVLTDAVRPKDPVTAERASLLGTLLIVVLIGRLGGRDRRSDLPRTIGQCSQALGQAAPAMAERRIRRSCKCCYLRHGALRQLGADCRLGAGWFGIGVRYCLYSKRREAAAAGDLSFCF